MNLESFSICQALKGGKKVRKGAFRLLLAVFLVMIAGCESSNSDPSRGIDTLQGGDGGSEDVGTSRASFHPDSHFTSLEDFFSWVNDMRKKYAEHARASGHPCDPNDKRGAVGSPVFPLKFAWDDDLARRAQQEAGRLAAGGAPKGVQFTNQGYDPVDAWGEGYFTGNWMLSAFEDVTMVTPPSMMDLTHWNYFPLSTSNGMARVGLWFQDFHETGPVITRLGIGASVVANGTWWVLQFGIRL